MGGYGPGEAEVRGRSSRWCGYVTRIGGGSDFGCGVEKHTLCYVDHPKALSFDAARRELTETGIRTKRFSLEVHQVPYSRAWVIRSRERPPSPRFLF